jgi:hypothetical protein
MRGLLLLATLVIGLAMPHAARADASVAVGLPGFQLFVGPPPVIYEAPPPVIYEAPIYHRRPIYRPVYHRWGHPGHGRGHWKHHHKHHGWHD